MNRKEKRRYNKKLKLSDREFEKCRDIASIEQ